VRGTVLPVSSVKMSFRALEQFLPNKCVLNVSFWRHNLSHMHLVERLAEASNFLDSVIFKYLLIGKSYLSEFSLTGRDSLGKRIKDTLAFCWLATGEEYLLVGLGILMCSLCQKISQVHILGKLI